MSDLAEALEVMVKPFFERGDNVHVVKHCGRLFVGKLPPQTCRVCGQKPTTVQMNRSDNPADIVAKLG